jgi:replicative DNA helicase
MSVSLNKLSVYGSSFQVKVISSLLKNKEFLQTISDLLDPEFFDSTSHKWIVEEVMRYFQKYNTNPTIDSLSVELKKIDNEVLRLSVAEQIKESYKISNDDQEYIEQEFANFCKNQKLKQALLDSVDQLKVGNYDEIRALIDHALKAGQDKNIGHNFKKDVESRYRPESRNAIPTPWEVLNDLLQGGLGEGDLGLVFGNPGGGKSWFLVALGAYAASLGYNVNHYTLELSEGYVGKRYDSFLTGIPVNEIGDRRPEVNKILENLEGNIIIKEYPMGSTRLGTIEAHIRKCTELDSKPDLIIIDYLDLLKSSRRKSSERKDEIDDVYMGAKGMARKIHIPVWSASQVNRMGAQDKVIEGDKAAGSYDKMMISDFATSLSRKRKDKVQGTGRFHIMKNRFGPDGMTYPATINTSNGHIDISTHEFSEDDDDEAELTNSKNPKSPTAPVLFNKEEKNILKRKFYNLVNEQE